MSISSGSPRILRSPKTPVKRAGSAVGKDTICLLCGTSLIGERCTFNVLQHVGLLQKVERLLDDQLNTNVQSSRVCRPCGRKVESLAKKKEVLTEQLKDLRAKYQTACNKTSRVKRLSKASPAPRARKKLRSPLTLQSSETGCEDNSDLENCFSILPGDDHNNIDIKQSSHVAKDLSKVHPQTEMAINVTSECECEPLPQEAPVQVVICYPSGDLKKTVHGEIANVVKYLALGLFSASCKAIMKASVLRDTVKELVVKQMDDELENLCRKQTNSILRQTKPEELVSFDMSKLVCELEKEAPFVWQVLKSVSSSKNMKRAEKRGDQVQDLTTVCATIAATVLHTRCAEMSALAYRIGLLLRYSGAGGMGLDILFKIGLTCNPRTLALKMKDLGKNHDMELIQWKSRSELENEVKRAHGMVREELSSLSYLPELPSKDDFRCYAEQLKTSETVVPCTSDSTQLSTLDANCLNLACANHDPQTLIHNICTKLSENRISREGIIGCLETMTETNPQGATTPGYQIIGDNCDLHVNVRHMTTDNRNKSFHWFNRVAFKDQVSGDHLPDIHETTLEDVPVSAFFPNSEEIVQLKRDFMTLWSRVVVKHLEKFSFLKNAVVYHIPHEYTEVMKQPVPEIPLGVVPKNENVNEDMVDILESLQSLYVPMSEVQLGNGETEKGPLQTVFFGGDQLTEERARNVQLARSDGRTSEERLQGLWPKNEDWHAIRIAYKVVIDILRKKNSVGDWGTFASNAVITGNSNALGDVLSDNYDKIREFFQTENDAFIISASLSYFGMKKTSDHPTANCFPEDLRGSTFDAKRKWLHEEVFKMLDMYVMDSMEPLEENGQPLDEEVKCREIHCQRTFKYRKCRIRHEQLSHNLFLEDTETLSEEKTEKKAPEEDHVFNYGCLHLSLGLLLRNVEDAVKEGDGARLLRVWKFLTFLYRLKGRNKYALAGLRVQASILGLLTPRDAHRFTWNRFAGLQEGPGSRIPRDLRMEQLNKVAKEEIRALGFQNINDQSVQENTKSEGNMEKILQGAREDFGLNKRKGHHANKTRNVTFSTILEQVHHKGAVFKFAAGREFRAFPKFQRNIFQGIQRKSTHRWINKHKRKWHRQNRLMYKHA